MRTTIIFGFSFFVFLTQPATAQDGVRSSKKGSNTPEVKTTTKVTINNEKAVKKDSTTVNTIKNNNTKKNPEKTSPNKKN